MTDAVQAPRVLDYLAALAPGVIAVALLDRAGKLVAGDPGLGARARASQAPGTSAPDQSQGAAIGTEGLAIECDRHGLLAVLYRRSPAGVEELLRHDMCSALGLLCASGSDARVDPA